jgi:hypothetical protein
MRPKKLEKLLIFFIAAGGIPGKDPVNGQDQGNIGQEGQPADPGQAGGQIQGNA